MIEKRKTNGIAYQIYGQGHCLVFLHGFGEDGSIWENQINYFKERYQIIIPDLRGTGESDSIKEESISIESMAEDVKKILDTERINACTIFGHSMGGYIALAFAELFPEILNGIGLIHSTSFADTEVKKDARKKGIEFIKQNGSKAFLSAAVPNLFGEKFRTSFPELLNHLLQKSYEINKETLISYYEAMMKRKDRTPLLINAKFPVLIFIGEEDKAVSPEDALYQSTLPSKCQVKLVPGIAHTGMWQTTEILNNEIADYLSWISD